MVRGSRQSSLFRSLRQWPFSPASRSFQGGRNKALNVLSIEKPTGMNSAETLEKLYATFLSQVSKKRQNTEHPGSSEPIVLPSLSLKGCAWACSGPQGSSLLRVKVRSRGTMARNASVPTLEPKRTSYINSAAKQVSQLRKRMARQIRRLQPKLPKLPIASSAQQLVLTSPKSILEASSLSKPLPTGAPLFTMSGRCRGRKYRVPGEPHRI